VISPRESHARTGRVLVFLVFAVYGKTVFKPAFARFVHLFLYFDIIRGSAYIWKLQFKNCLCDSQECLEFVRRLLDCSVLRGELCFVFQVFRVRLSIIGLFCSQGRAVLRVSGV